MRLDRLVASRGAEIALDWRSFLLRTSPKTPDRDAFADYTRSWLRPAEMEPEARFRMWDDDSANPPSSSLPAQVAAKAVARVAPERSGEFHHALLAAYFSENRDISDEAELARLAASVGVDVPAWSEAMTGSRAELASEVIDDHNAAVERGIHAVPSVLVADRLVVPGAQDVEVYERIIDRLLEKQGAG